MNMKNEYVSPEIEIVSLGEIGTDVVSASGKGEWDLPEIDVEFDFESKDNSVAY